jgi:hypothetical protein
MPKARLLRSKSAFVTIVQKRARVNSFKKVQMKYPVRIAFIAALAGFIFGFDTVVISGANLAD